MLDRLEDTIVAISSAPGSAPVGIVRLSGPAAMGIAGGISRCQDSGQPESSGSARRLNGELMLAGGLRLPAFFCIFRGPHSYTRQDVVEIYSIGAPPLLEAIQQACIAAGARRAEPGEFTARAFLNGAMDLAKAEAVAGVVRAQSDAQLRASRHILDGALGRRVTALRDSIAELLALVEADIDFAEEPIEFITPREAVERLAGLLADLEQMRGAVHSIERLDRLPRILLLGPPNAGKSTLMNALSGTPRAICAAVAGTTRDILSAPIQIGRGEAVLLDSAGVDETEDEIIAQARALTLSTAEQVDLVCMVLDAAAIAAADPSVPRFVTQVNLLRLPAVITVVNKCDLLGQGPLAPHPPPLITNPPLPSHPSPLTRHIRLPEQWSLGPAVPVSAATGDGLAELRQTLWNALGRSDTTASAEVIFLTERQCTATQEALSALRRASELAAAASETIDCADLLAFELREALDTLGAVTGAVTTEDLLGQVFARFCIGK